MKKIIESLFSLFFNQPENITESEKTPFWKMPIILLIIGLMVLVIYLVEK
jgi:hypothetical protein